MWGRWLCGAVRHLLMTDISQVVARQGNLDASVCPPLPSSCTAHHTAHVLRELNTARPSVRPSAPTHEAGLSSPSCATTLEPAPKHYLLANVFRMFQCSLIWMIPTKLLSFGCDIVQIYLLSLIFQILQEEALQQIFGSSNQLYMYAAIIVAIGLVRPLINPIYFVECHRLSLRSRSATVALIFEQLLKLDYQTTSVFTTGHMVNLISLDAQRLGEALFYAPALVLAPVYLIVSTYMIWREIGAFALLVVSFLLLVLPFYVVVGGVLGGLQDNISHQSDRRLKIVSELLEGIRILKMYAWERPFFGLVQRVRREEVSLLARSNAWWATVIGLVFVLPCININLSFLIYVGADHIATILKVFVTAAYINAIKIEFTYYFPFALKTFFEARVACQRIEAFLALRSHHRHDREMPPKLETPADSVMSNSVAETQMALAPINAQSLARMVSRVLMTRVSFEWEAGKPVLQDVSLEVQAGSSLGVFGPVGCGKTTLLLSLMNEVRPSKGRISNAGRCVYASQEPWIRACSFRENLLFGNEYEEEWYNEVVFACSLTNDLAELASGDATEIGERGITLSGGQKARLSLARAVYARCDVYLLDDPLSAVDVKVANHIFEFCIRRLLAEKVVILVTHQTQFLSRVDAVLELGEKGTVKHYGAWQVNDKDTGHRRLSLSNEVQCAQQRQVAFQSKPLFMDEQEQQGWVAKRAYSVYLTGGESRLWLGVLLASVCGLVAFQMYSDWTLAKWAQLLDFGEQSSRQWYGAVAGTTLASMLVLLAWMQLFVWRVSKSSQSLHDGMLEALLSTSVVFFDSNPIGRIVNRFSSDLRQIDTLLLWAFVDVLICSCTGGAIVMFVASNNPWLFLAAAPMVAVFVLFARYFMRSQLVLKRLELKLKSPIFSHLAATIHGLISIRCHAAEKWFQADMNKLIDEHTNVDLTLYRSERWLSIRIEYLIVVFLAVVLFTSLATRESLQPGIVALSIVYTISLLSFLDYLIKRTVDLQTLMTSTERVLEYAELPSEHKTSEARICAPQDWPAQGEIEFRSVGLQYRAGLAPALHDINMLISPGEKIGIVGRTGAGKSSLLVALFRLAGTITGEILIDGIDTRTLELGDVRSRISVIPQDPTLFSGSLRYNLDPFGQYEDAMIWAALEQVELKALVSSLAGALEFVVSEAGSNFSVGQRQLVCLARAILRQNKVLVLDEATANVDNATDALIQQTIRTCFAHCTVLTIAHRLRTIIDSDRVLVMAEGRVAELGPPRVLLGQSDSMFAALVHELPAAEKTELFTFVNARQAPSVVREEDSASSKPSLFSEV
eukprot:m.624142 g.624142  ORF g.624142 m.624142 type:complete len:1306 (+) comp58229_c0_seq3:123-4040(+)